MTDLTPNHPAVEAAARSAYERAWCGENEPWSEVDDLERDEWRADEAHSLTAALPHLTADDLRNTPAGRALMAEAWDERHATRPNYSQGHDDDCMGWEDCRCGRYLNPYRKADA